MPYVCKLNEVEILFLMIVLGIIYNCCSVSIYGNISHFLIQSKMDCYFFYLWCCCRRGTGLNQKWIGCINIESMNDIKVTEALSEKSHLYFYLIFPVASNHEWHNNLYSTVHASVTSPFLPTLNKIRLFFRTHLPSRSPKQLFGEWFRTNVL